MGTVTVAIDLADKGFSRGILEARRNTQQLKQSVKEIGETAPSSIQAASAAIRVLEGGMTGNIRAAERFISSIKGVGPVLQAAFPVVGLIAVGGIFVRIAEEAYRALHQLSQIRNVASEGFAAIAEGGMKSADMLRVANDRLENEIALMEHKPVNNMALALDEARARADDLATSLDKDYQGFKKINEQSREGFLSKITNSGVNKVIGDSMQDQLANMRTLARQQRDALRAGNQPAAADAGAKLRTAQETGVIYANAQLTTKAFGTGVTGDAVNAFKDIVQNQQDNADQQNLNTMASARAQADRDRNKLIEEGNKARAELLKKDENLEKERNAFNRMSINEEIQFWTGKLAAFQKGTQQYLQVQDKIYEEISKRPSLFSVNEKNEAATGKFQVEGSDMLRAGAEAFRRIDLGNIERANRLSQEFAQSTDKIEEAQRRATAAYREASVSLAREQGTMSNLAAAQEVAKIHAEDHATAIALVNRQLERQIDLIKQTPDEKMGPEEKASAIELARQNAGFEKGGLDSVYAITQKQDQADVDGNTVIGAQKNALNRMVQSWDDLATNLKQIIPQTLQSLNEDIVKLATGQGHRGDFGKTFMHAGQSALNAAIQKGEGMALKAFGLGKLMKADGSKENPFYTIAMAGHGAPAGINTTNPSVTAGIDLGKLIPGTKFIQPFISPLLSALPHFAGGGDVTANHPSLVGERGPEMFVPHTSGRIVPNHMLGGGGGDTHVYHIDARGATDPAAIHAAVARALPQAVSASIHAMHQRALRTAQGR